MVKFILKIFKIITNPLDSSIIGLHNLFLNNWYTFYYGYSGFDTLFLCTGVLSLITSHLRNGLKQNAKGAFKKSNISF